jgi:hypothetical protein
MVGRLLHFRKVNDLLAYGSQVTDDTINVVAMSVIQTAVGGLITDELEPGQRLLRAAPQVRGGSTERGANKTPQEQEIASRRAKASMIRVSINLCIMTARPSYRPFS